MGTESPAHKCGRSLGRAGSGGGRGRESVPGPTLREHQRLLCGTPTIRAVPPWDRGCLQPSPWRCTHSNSVARDQSPTKMQSVWEPLRPPVQAR